jgi:DNA gyrase/topoisomerase IV subunit A
MDKHIPDLYKKYGYYINSFRAFPISIDGLKLVERRLLLSTYQVARNDFTKSARVDGHNMGTYHPHGSTYSTIVNLVHRKLLVGQGSFGSDMGISPTGAAASRYTEVKSSKFIKEICFKNIEYVPWEVNELDQSEPTFLPTMYPVCFLGNEYVQGIGFGYRTLIPTYKSSDLYRRLMWLLNKTETKPTIKPFTSCDVVSSKKELEDLLTTGEATIKLKGKIKEDRAHSRIHLKSWSPLVSFEKLIQKIPSFENGDIGVIDLSNETVGCDIVFEVAKKKNKEEIYNKFLEQLQGRLEADINFKINMVDIQSQTVKTMSVDSLLLSCYNTFKNVNGFVLKSKIEKLQEKEKEYNILKKIRPHLSKIMIDKDVKDKDFDYKVALLSLASKVEENDIRMLLQKYNIEKLLKLDTDTTQLQNSINELKESFKNLEIYVLKQYDEIQNNDVDGGSNV